MRFRGWPLTGNDSAERGFFVLSASILPTTAHTRMHSGAAPMVGCSSNGGVQLRWWGVGGAAPMVGCWRSSLRGCDPPLDPQAGPGKLEASSPHPCPGNVHLPLFPLKGPLPGHSLECDVRLRPSWAVCVTEPD